MTAWLFRHSDQNAAARSSLQRLSPHPTACASERRSSSFANVTGIDFPPHLTPCQPCITIADYRSRIVRNHAQPGPDCQRSDRPREIERGTAFLVHCDVGQMAHVCLVVIEAVGLARVQPLLPIAFEPLNFFRRHRGRNEFQDGETKVCWVTLPQQSIPAVPGCSIVSPPA